MSNCICKNWSMKWDWGFKTNLKMCLTISLLLTMPAWLLAKLKYAWKIFKWLTSIFAKCRWTTANGSGNMRGKVCAKEICVWKKSVHEICVWNESVCEIRACYEILEGNYMSFWNLLAKEIHALKKYKCETNLYMKSVHEIWNKSIPKRNLCVKEVCAWTWCMKQILTRNKTNRKKSLSDREIHA